MEKAEVVKLNFIRCDLGCVWDQMSSHGFESISIGIELVSIDSMCSSSTVTRVGSEMMAT